MDTETCRCGFAVSAHNERDLIHCGITDPVPFTREERDELSSGWTRRGNEIPEWSDIDRYEATVRDLENIVLRLERDLVAAVRAR